MLNRQRRFKVFAGSIESFCAQLLKALNQTDGGVSIILVGPRRMQTLNRKYRGKNYPTDVLSFVYGEESVEGIPFLGEVVISPEIAWLQARRRKADPEKEMRMLLLHGILHLLGYDHETDHGEMNRLQARVMRGGVFLNSAPVADMRLLT